MTQNEQPSSGWPPGTAAPMLVVYDADCGLCSRIAQALRILDRPRRLRLVPLQRASELLGGESPPMAALQAVLHVRDTDGKWWTGGGAALRIAASVPLLSPLAHVGRLPIFSGMVEPGYQLLARNRDRLGRLLGAARCRFSGDLSPD